MTDTKRERFQHMQIEHLRAANDRVYSAKQRHVYFLLSIAAAAIAFSLSQTHAIPIHPSQMPLALAIFAWAVSFFLGCRAERSHIRYTQAQVTFFREFDTTENSDNETNAENQDRLHKQREKSEAQAQHQFITLLIGAALYITWHVFEMWQLFISPPPPS